MIQRVRKPFFGTGVRAIHRAEKFLVLRGRYEMLIQSADAIISPTIAEMFDRVPRMTGDSTSDEYLNRVKDAITWSDVDVLWEAVIGALPDADLRDQLNFTRLAYMQTVPSSEYSRYEKSMFDLGTMTSPLEDSVSQRMRSELLAVSQRVKYMLEYGPLKEEARARLTTRVILTMCVGILVVALAYIGAEIFVAGHGNAFVPPEAVFVVLCAGLVGGFISVQQRLQQPTDVDPLYKWLELHASGSSLLLSPIIGMLFAVVLYAVLMGGFVTGSLFPTFTGCGRPTELLAAHHCAINDLASFTLAATPDSPVSWAKLTVWAFLAGFLERLVPDILTRIAAVAQKT